METSECNFITFFSHLGLVWHVLYLPSGFKLEQRKDRWICPGYPQILLREANYHLYQDREVTFRRYKNLTDTKINTSEVCCI